MADDKLERLTRIETGTPGLDAILNGGLIAGGMYIVRGTPGSGKTILANAMAFHQARGGKRVVYMTLLSEPHDRMLQYLNSLSFVDLSLIPEAIQYISGYASLIEGGPDSLKLAVFDIVNRHRADLLILDGLYVAQERTESAAAFREFIHSLQGLAQLRRCTMLLLTNGPNESFSPEQTMVDGIIELRRHPSGVRTIRMLEVLKMRGGAVLEGPHKYRIADGGLVVYPRLEMLVADSRSEVRSTALVSSGIDGLDRMLGGGFPENSTTLLAGPSGSGKTSAGLCFIARATPDAPGVLFSSYETVDELRMKAAAIGLDLEALERSGALRIVWRRAFETYLDELAHHLLDAVDATRARRVFIDGADAFRRAAVFPERLTAYFTALSLRLRTVGATTLFTAEARELFHPQDLVLAEISPVAENMLLLRFDESQGRLQRTLGIIKIRQRGFDPSVVPFTITDGGIVVQPPG
jgi:circadian clock protein KaiC